MQVQNFELNDFNKPVKMHFEYKKYWEIKMEEDRGTDKFKTIRRAGKFQDGQEIRQTEKVANSEHDNIVQAIDFMENHIKAKLSKGYIQFTDEEIQQFTEQQRQNDQFDKLQPQSSKKQQSVQETQSSEKLLPDLPVESQPQNNNTSEFDSQDIQKENEKRIINLQPLQKLQSNNEPEFIIPPKCSNIVDVIDDSAIPVLNPPQNTQQDKIKSISSSGGSATAQNIQQNDEQELIAPVPKAQQQKPPQQNSENKIKLSPYRNSSVNNRSSNCSPMSKESPVSEIVAQPPKNNKIITEIEENDEDNDDASTTDNIERKQNFKLKKSGSNPIKKKAEEDAIIIQEGTKQIKRGSSSTLHAIADEFKSNSDVSSLDNFKLKEEDKGPRSPKENASTNKSKFKFVTNKKYNHEASKKMKQDELLEQDPFSPSHVTNEITEDIPPIYLMSPQRGFRGDLLVKEMRKETFYVRFHVLNHAIKVEQGTYQSEEAPQINILEYKSKSEAIAQTRIKIAEKIAQGYKRKSDDFVFDFEEKEIKKLYELQSDDEDDEEENHLQQQEEQKSPTRIQVPETPFNSYVKTPLPPIMDSNGDTPQKPDIIREEVIIQSSNENSNPESKFSSEDNKAMMNEKEDSNFFYNEKKTSNHDKSGKNSNNEQIEQNEEEKTKSLFKKKKSIQQDNGKMIDEKVVEDLKGSQKSRKNRNSQNYYDADIEDVDEIEELINLSRNNSKVPSVKKSATTDAKIINDFLVDGDEDSQSVSNLILQKSGKFVPGQFEFDDSKDDFNLDYSSLVMKDPLFDNSGKVTPISQEDLNPFKKPSVFENIEKMKKFQTCGSFENTPSFHNTPTFEGTPSFNLPFESSLRSKRSNSQAGLLNSQPIDLSLGKAEEGPSKLLLAQTWDQQQEVNGWYMSEKLDGIRCYWNGSEMWSRSGKKYSPPDWFVKDFPKSPLDGELWLGRGKFHHCVNIIKRDPPLDNEWKRMVYMVFDAPGLDKPFDQRLKRIREVVEYIDSPYLMVHQHQICQDNTHVKNELEYIEKVGGEGLMLREPHSLYEKQRSYTLLKVKSFQDAEAQVIGYEENRMKNYQGLVAALKVKNTKGNVFLISAGLPDDLKMKPPKGGTIITYKYQMLGLTGAPKNPIFVRIRDD